MACGKPIVISRAGGTQSTIEDGISGFFVDVGDVDMIEKKCTEMLSNTSLAEKMGHNACNRAVSQFGQEQMVEDLLSVSEKLIKHASSVTQSRSRWQEVVNNSYMRQLDDITLKSTAPIREREDLDIDFNRTAATFLRYDWAARTLCRRLPAMSNILEVGCGLGLGTCLFNSLGFKVTGVDASSETIDEARRRFPWLNFKKALAEEFTMPQSYDAIVALEVLEHISDWKRVVQNWKSSLKEGGILVLSTPNRVFNSENPHSPRNRFHLHEFSIDELQTLFPNCQVRGISLRIFKSRFDNLLVRSLFFLLTLTISPFELKRSFVGGAENFSRRDLIYGKLGYWFPQWSGGFLLTWKKDG
jgi:2-polyprenyl-3-methyl-5-hydroxy-6-metoxy-1,4-benzoquinol methylase